jgi:hypothetical protein
MFAMFAVCSCAVILGNPAPLGAAPGADQAVWLFLAPPLGDPTIKKVVIDPLDDRLWYVTSQSGGLYITRDNSSTWEQHLSGNVGAVAYNPRASFMVFASSQSDLYWSLDSGQTWTLLHSFPGSISGSPTFIDSILVSAIDGSIVVGLGSLLHTARIYKGVFVGGSFQFNIVWESQYGYHFWDIAEDPLNGYWFFSTEDSQHIGNPVVMRSKDRGASWEEMTPLTGFADQGHGLNLEVHPLTQTVYFLRENSFLSMSSDSRDSWADSFDVDFGRSLLLDPSCPNRVFGGEMVRGVKIGGVYVSGNGGQSFVYEGPANNTISSMALHNDGNGVLAVATGQGFWYQYFGTTLPCTTDVAFFADGFELGDMRRWDGVVGWP